MSILPKHPLTRIAALLWLSACVAFLILTLLQKGLYENERSALARLVLVYFLGFPCGHVALLIVNKIKIALYASAAFSPSILSECVFLWTLTTVLGYVQWFILLPWLSQKCLQLSRALFNRRNTQPLK
jgi:hypothetical protein